MKKILLLLFLVSSPAVASGRNCYHQSNPMGYQDYDVCEVEGTGYSCVTLKDKTNSGISCFPTPVAEVKVEEKKSDTRPKYKERESW